MKPESNFDFLMELAVWGHLNEKRDLELIMLKGHLLLEVVLDTALQRRNIKSKSLSFYGKICVLEKVRFADKNKKELVVASLGKLNQLRNELAHDFGFEAFDGRLEDWANNILNNLQGTKYTRFTFRTRIVHAFSILAINILE